MTTVQTTRLDALDGFPLTAHRFTAHGERRGNLLVAGATGVPQRFYRPFAEYAAARGYETLTLDYRGVGQSAPASLRGFQMVYRDWASLDLAAAVDAMSQDERPLFLVGHSFGGHALGLLPNHERVARVYTFATGAGWHGWMPPLERVRVLFLWYLFGPVLTRWKGYLAWSLAGLGADLPLGVYRDWKRWCRYPRYFFDDPEFGVEAHRLFDRVHVPIVAANALDDRWAPPASRDAFMAGYRNAEVTAVDIDPRAAGVGPIGHMGYFLRRAESLWADVLAWFGQHESGTAKLGPMSRA
jgi:predicted alpha/beta hydrolase